jgi:hypothetical protein
MNVSNPGRLADLVAVTTSSFNSSSKFLCSLPSLLSVSSWKQYLIPVALGYVALCRALRYHGEKRLRRRMGFPEGCGREALARMTNEQAQQIIKYLAAYEFPEFHLLALQFGIFKVPALPLSLPYVYFLSHLSLHLDSCAFAFMTWRCQDTE